MSGWTEREHNSVKIIHHSASSLIEMIITEEEESEPGKTKIVKKTVWFNYETFADLQEVIKQAI